jgi:hypothetical protein
MAMSVAPQPGKTTFSVAGWIDGFYTQEVVDASPGRRDQHRLP